MSGNTEQDRRQHPRVTAEMKIRAVPISEVDARRIQESLCIPDEKDVEQRPGVIYTASMDLSEGGLKGVSSLEQGGPVPEKGDHYLVEFLMPPGGRKALIHAVVMWATVVGNNKTLVGMRFETASPRDEARIREFVEGSMVQV